MRRNSFGYSPGIYKRRSFVNDPRQDALRREIEKGMPHKYYPPGTIAVMMSINTKEGRKWVRVPNYIKNLTDAVNSADGETSFEELNKAVANFWYNKLHKEKSLKLLFINFVQRCVASNYFGKVPTWFSKRLSSRSSDTCIEDYYRKARRIIVSFLLFTNHEYDHMKGDPVKLAYAAGHLIAKTSMKNILEIAHVETNRLKQKQMIRDALAFKDYKTDLVMEARIYPGGDGYTSRYKSIWDILIELDKAQYAKAPDFMNTFLCQDLVKQFLHQVNFVINSPYDYTDEILIKGLVIPSNPIGTHPAASEIAEIMKKSGNNTISDADLTDIGHRHNLTQAALLKLIDEIVKLVGDNSIRTTLNTQMNAYIPKKPDVKGPKPGPTGPIINPPDPIPDVKGALSGAAFDKKAAPVITEIKKLGSKVKAPELNSVLNANPEIVLSLFHDDAATRDENFEKMKREIGASAARQLRVAATSIFNKKYGFGARMRRYRDGRYCNRGSRFGAPVDLTRMTGYVRPYDISAMENYTGMTPDMYRRHNSRNTGAPYGGMNGPIPRANSYYGNYRNGEALNPSAGYGRRRNYNHRPGIGASKLPGTMRRGPRIGNGRGRRRYPTYA